MRIVVETVDERVGVVVGYGPGPKGSPRAIVVLPDGTFRDYPLGEIKAGEFNKRERRRIARRLGASLDEISQAAH